jgi:hypothetical protein
MDGSVEERTPLLDEKSTSFSQDRKELNCLEARSRLTHLAKCQTFFRRIANRQGLDELSRDRCEDECPISQVGRYAQYLATTDITLVADEQEKRIRINALIEHLPELAQYSDVSFQFQGHHWVVQEWTCLRPKSTRLPLPDSIAGCPVYMWETPNFPAYRGTVGFQPGFLVSEFGASNLTPEEFLAYDYDLCEVIQVKFSRCIGIRLHAWDFVGVLYATKAKMNKDAGRLYKHRSFPDTLCHRSFDLKVLDKCNNLPGTRTVFFDPDRHWRSWIDFVFEKKRIYDEREERRLAKVEGPTTA